MIARFQQSYLYAIPMLLALAALSIPISSTGKSIAIPLVSLLILLTPVYRKELRCVLYKPWCIATLALFSLVVLGCFWSPADWKDKLMVIEKYSKLLYLPLLVVGFREERVRIVCLHVFLVAMLITCVISFLKFIGLSSYNGEMVGTVFRNHIMTSYMMSFAAYVSGWLYHRTYLGLLGRRDGKGQKNRRVKLIWYGALFILFGYQIIFINSGRTGYIIYALLMILLMLQMLPWRFILLGLFLLMASVILSYYVSPIMHFAVQQTIGEWRDYQKNEKNTSMGFRFQFHDYANNLFRRHPGLGNGTAGFIYLYRTENPIPARQGTVLEPHSQYWLTASDWGILGCIALGGFFLSLLIEALSLNALHGMALAVLLPFMVGNLTDSLLFYSGTGYFFLLFIALCLGENKRP